MVVCRLQHGQRITGGKILCVNKRRGAQSKNSRLKRVHLLFDEDGNPAGASSEGGTVTERVKSFLKALEKDSDKQLTSVVPSSSTEAVQDCTEVGCSSEDQISCSYDDVSNAVLDNCAEYCSSLTVGATDADSTCQDSTKEAAVELESCCDEVNKETGDCTTMAISGCAVAPVVASSDPVTSKYWWQRYRLFSRFDRGIMIDQGW